MGKLFRLHQTRELDQMLPDQTRLLWRGWNQIKINVRAFVDWLSSGSFRPALGWTPVTL